MSDTENIKILDFGNSRILITTSIIAGAPTVFLTEMADDDERDPKDLDWQIKEGVTLRMTSLEPSRQLLDAMITSFSDLKAQLKLQDIAQSEPAPKPKRKRASKAKVA